MKILSLLICLFAAFGVMVSCSQISEGLGVTHDQDVNSNIATNFISDNEIRSLMERYLLHEYYTRYESLEIDSTSVDDSGMFFKVTNEEYDTWSEWTLFCESIFHGEALYDSIEQSEMIKNIDGYTYCCPGSIGWYLSNEYTYEIVKSNPERALIQISRQEITPGENEETERIWFYLLGLTENGWRILNIISFR